MAPVKGWNTYDTIAVKWRGQVVASRRVKEIKPVELPTEEEMSGDLDINDNETTLPSSPDDLAEPPTHTETFKSYSFLKIKVYPKWNPEQ